jgi:hypothetical protein
MLHELLYSQGGYDDIYAKWLSKNLHCLNDISVMLLDKDGTESEPFVRLSLVTNFDFNNELPKFKCYCNGAFQGMSTDKLDILKDSIKKSQEQEVFLDLDQLKEVLQLLTRFRKLQTPDKEKLRAATINHWPAVIKDIHSQKELFDSPQAKAAEEDIFKDHPEFMVH